MRQGQIGKTEVGSTGRLVVITPGPTTKLPENHEPPDQNSHTPYWDDTEGYHDIRAKISRNRVNLTESLKSSEDFKSNHKEGIQRMAKIGNIELANWKGSEDDLILFDFRETNYLENNLARQKNITWFLVEETLNAGGYLKVLEDCFLDVVDEDMIFQHDNASIHKVILFYKRWLNERNLLIDLHILQI
ncbi:9531_t:CDS:2 [Scutellospora calospora]|uniref:9531_t:CDS:1 n=1 Tax=Scutellospora calospora TaxID=85575 RepID=A0ACA9KVI5_9GLOM|nr:9531_t:CDS:2 [Scutellospora calospora]